MWFGRYSARCGKRDENRQSDDIGDDERDDAIEDRGEVHVLHHGLDDEHVHPDRRMDQPKFHRHHDDHAEPHGIEAQRGDDRKDDRDRQDDHRHRVHQAAEDEIHQHDQHQHAVAAEAETGDERGHLLRRLRHREEVAEQDGADQDGEHRGGGAGGLQQRGQNVLARQPAARDTDQERAGRADTSRLGRREQSAIQSADDEHEQQQRRPDVAHRLGAFAPGAARRRRQIAGPDGTDHRDRRHVHADGEQSRQNARHEQLADVLLRDQPIDREHDRWREHRAQRAAGRDHAGRERLRIMVQPHLGIRDGGECRGGGDR